MAEYVKVRMSQLNVRSVAGVISKRIFFALFFLVLAPQIGESSSACPAGGSVVKTVFNCMAAI